MESEGCSLFTLYCGLWCLRNVLHAQQRNKPSFRWELVSAKGAFELQPEPSPPLEDRADMPIGRTCKLRLCDPAIELKAVIEISRHHQHLELHVQSVHCRVKDVVAANKFDWMASWTGASYHQVDGRMTIKGAHLQLISCLDRLAKQWDVVRIVVHSRSSADSFQKQLRMHGYHEVQFGGFGILRFEKVRRHPAMDRISVCVARDSRQRNTRQWYATVLGLNVNEEPTFTSHGVRQAITALNAESTPIHVNAVADPSSLIFPDPVTRGSSPRLESAVAIHVETCELDDWKRHLRMAGVKYQTDRQSVLDALHELTDTLFDEGIHFQDPNGLTIRVLAKQSQS